MSRHVFVSSARGFTLIELMIVVVIIGILAALAIPRFNVVSYKAKEKEADALLKQIYTLQQMHVVQAGAPATSVAELLQVGFSEPNHLEYYIWGGDASVQLGTCLQPKGTWSGRLINSDGAITDC